MPPISRPRSALRSFIKSESSAGLLLMAAAVVAMIFANTPLSGPIHDFLIMPMGSMVIALPNSPEKWVNDGLMAIFFLLVGLEIKREMVDGELSTWSRRALPGIAALGGMAVPAVLYLALNLTMDMGAPRGWAVPAATDIAFALGVLTLLGKRAPVSLKIFLMALAILDDLGAVVIIALFYTAGIDVYALLGAGITLLMMILINRLHVVRLAPYLVLAVVLWWFTHESGVHATIAGVLAALTIPVKRTPAQPESLHSPLHRLEHALQPFVGFIILPIFGLVNAGVHLGDVSLQDFLEPAPLGVAVGLFVGKQLGVFSACFIAIKAGIADVPANASWLQLYGVSMLCGIGFTMSLFISLLAFPNDPDRIEAVKLGVLLGSLLAGLGGAAILGLARPSSAPAADENA